ncbi:MAG: hypothetical protein Kow0074_23960 [Candidatus Zixiibacteriota bacterium]
MSRRTGRNDPCPCGSGQKMKNCHPNGYGKSSANRNIALIGSAIAILVIAVVVLVQDDSAAPVRGVPASMPVTTPASGATATPGGRTPQPPGPAPEGKVWSEEHGHWHNAPAGVTPSVQGSAQSQIQRTPQPPGPAPEGKVWSEEHGHWHDAPASTPQTTQPAGNATPVQPATGGP